MNSAIEMARMEAQGPSTILAMETPTAWPVVPPGSGRLNIMTTKENAANTEIRGISFVESSSFKPAQRDIPERGRAGVQGRAGGRTQIAIWDMHC